MNSHGIPRHSVGVSPCVIVLVVVMLCPGMQCADFYANVSGSAVMTFPYLGYTNLYIITADSRVLIYITQWYTSQMDKRFSFIGNFATNNITVLVTNVTQDDAGIYLCASSKPSVPLSGCNTTLVVLDRPTTPSVTFDKVPVVGEEVMLTCNSQSTSLPLGKSKGLLYEWKEEGADIENATKSFFTVHNVTKFDLGKAFSCQSTEVDGPSSHESFAIPLPVRCVQEPDNPSITIAEPGSNATFTISIPPSIHSDDFFVVNTSCYGVLSVNTSSSGHSKVSGTYHDRLHVVQADRHNVTFSLSQVTTLDAGFYSCGDGNEDAMVENCGQKLIVLGIPTKPNLTSSVTPYVGNPVVLHCSSNSTSLPPDDDLAMTFTWFRNGQQLGQPSPSALLEVKVIEKENSGDTYVCVSREERGLRSEDSYPYIMMPDYPPGNVSFNYANNTVSVVEGDENVTQVECVADCRPNCTYMWYRNAQHLSQGKAFGLVNLTRAQAGLYSCTASNKHGSSSGEVFVNVLYPAKVLSYSMNSQIGSVQVKENATVSLFCRVEGNPLPSVSFVNGSDMIHSVANTLAANMSWRGASCLDSGLYTCEANNNLGPEVFQTVQLRVTCRPRVDSREMSRPQVFAPLGSRAELRAHFLAYPWPAFLWSRELDNGSVAVNHSHVHQLDQVQESALVFAAVKVEDFGVYRVQASNSLGSAEMLLQLDRSDPPEQPGDFFCVGRTVSSLSVQWTAHSDHDSPQSFTLKYFQKGFATLPAVHEHIPDPGLGQEVTMNLTSLSSDTMYFLQLLAVNRWGHSAQLEITCFTAESPSEGFKLTFEQGLGIGLAVCLIAIIALVIFVCRKRMQRYRKRKKQSVILEHIYQDLSDQPLGDPSLEDAVQMKVRRPERSVRYTPLPPIPRGVMSPRQQEDESSLMYSVPACNGSLYSNLERSNSSPGPL